MWVVVGVGLVVVRMFRVGCVGVLAGLAVCRWWQCPLVVVMKLLVTTSRVLS